MGAYPLGIYDVAKVLKVYPNPVQEQLLIASNRKVEEVVIYNAMGQCLHQATYTG